MTIKREANETVDESRRGFAKIGAAAPVLMTLASQPVFGANCLSNALSGNLSDPDRGNCAFGWSPGGWRNTQGAEPNWEWVMPQYHYGDYDPSNTWGDNKSCGKPSTQNKWECYSDGTPWSLTPIFGTTALGSSDPDKTLREILNTEEGSLRWLSVAALLNATASENHNPAGFTYILTVLQLVGLLNGDPLPPGFTDLGDFLDWTWNGGTEGQP